MGGYVIYIDGFIDLAKARYRKMARAWGWSDISSGEFSSYTQVYADLRRFMPCKFSAVMAQFLKAANRAF